MCLGPFFVDSFVAANVFTIPDYFAFRLTPLGHISRPLQHMAAVAFTVSLLSNTGFAFELLAGWPAKAFADVRALGSQSVNHSQIPEPWGRNL